MQTIWKTDTQAEYIRIYNGMLKLFPSFLCLKYVLCFVFQTDANCVSCCVGCDHSCLGKLRHELDARAIQSTRKGPTRARTTAE